MDNLQGAQDNLFPLMLNTYLQSQVTEVTSRFYGAMAMLSAYPYSNPEKERLITEYRSLKPLVDRVQEIAGQGTAIDAGVAKAMVESIRPRITKFYDAVILFKDQAKSGGSEYIKMTTSKGEQYYTKTPQEFYNVPGGPTIEQRVTDKTAGVPNWLLLTGVGILALAMLRR